MNNGISGLTSGIKDIRGKIGSSIETFSNITSERAENYLATIAGYRQEIRETLKKPKLPFKDKITLTYLDDLCSSTEAEVELNEKNADHDSKQMYELLLKIDGMSIADLKEVGIDYKNYVNQEQTMQENPLFQTHLIPVNANNKLEYRRKADGIIGELDKYASVIFDTQITTPASFDPKETSPHQFWGEIYVGIVNTVPKLYRIIAHEGPLGHNTHETLSSKSEMVLQCKHVKEGLAILGEYLVTEDFFKKSEHSVTNYLMGIQRSLGDSRAAFIEKMSYYDRLPAKKIVEKLDESGTKAKALLKSLETHQKNRDTHVTTDAAAYYVGGMRISKIYSDAWQTIYSELPTHLKTENQHKLLQVMYTGNRSYRVIELQVRELIETLRKKK